MLLQPSCYPLWPHPSTPPGDACPCPVRNSNRLPGNYLPLLRPTHLRGCHFHACNFVFGDGFYDMRTFLPEATERQVCKKVVIGKALSLRQLMRILYTAKI